MALEAVTDPEIPVVVIAELGILCDVQLDEDGSLVATIILIYSNCPAMEQVADDVSHALQAAGVGAYHVCSVLSPAWTTNWITAEGQRKLRDFGIVPPAHVVRADGARSIRLTRPAQGEHITCPQCGSYDTAFIFVFGSIVCRALYRCRTCHEPFDYFKLYWPRPRQPPAERERHDPAIPSFARC